MPACLQAVNEPLLEGGADVAVDASDAGQAVSEPFGLGSLGHAVFDEPGFVAVPQVVKVQSADDGGDAVGGVAVGGGSPVAAVEAGAAV